MLTGKTAVITGASRGIGKAVALKLASEGANIVINYRSSAEEATSLLAEIQELGVKAIAVQANVGVWQEAEALINRAKEEFGTVDVLVNNAGITKDGLIMRMSEEDFDQVVNINLKGIFNCCRFAVPIMLKQRSGRIINMTSVVGLLGECWSSELCSSESRSNRTNEVPG